jgi:glycosyltransferase involved in cell wall biosynthesis
MLAGVGDAATRWVADYEIVIVDNASDDGSLSVLKELTGADGLPNLQVYALTKEVGQDAASWVGIENALGDFTAVLDPGADDIEFLPAMLEAATTGADVVFAYNEKRQRRSIRYRFASAVFNRVYRGFTGIDLAKDAPHFRVLSKRVVNFILQHPQPARAYRHLPASGGFSRANLRYSAAPSEPRVGRTRGNVDRSMLMLVSTTRAPMRVVTTLSLFGALANAVYSGYVAVIWLTKPDVEPGWVSLSLQQSGMFFLLSLVLLVLGEYILQVVNQSSEGPMYHVSQEFTSARMSRMEKLNVVEHGAKPVNPRAPLPRTR